MNMSKLILTLSFLFISSTTFAHRPGFYQIAGNENAQVLFSKIEKCPEIEGALEGSLRVFTFSRAAEQTPYFFRSGFYVEIHTESGEEVYVNTDINCVPLKTQLRIPATRATFSDFDLEWLREINK